MWFFMLSAALAGTPAESAHTHHDFEAMQPEELYQDFLRFFEPHLVAEDDRLSDDTWHCGTGLVMAIKSNWTAFDAAQRKHMTQYIAPWKEDLSDPVIANSPPPPSMAPTETCFDAFPNKRPNWAGDGENRIITEHFSVEWDGDAISETRAQQWADALELSWQVEFEELGWRKPGGHTQYLTLAYIADFDYAGAVTSVENCGGSSIPFMIAGKGSFAQGTWFMDMASHELNHTSQFSYGYGHEFYFWEATATWIEEYIYPSHNSWAQYIVGYSQAPHLAINKSSQQDQEIFYHMYGMAILLFYLDEYVGGPEFVEELWRYSSNNGTQYDLWIGEVLEAKGEDWGELYDHFIATNAVMDYEEQAYFTAVNRADSVKSFPASGGNSSNDKPEGYGQNYIRIKTGSATAEAPDLQVNFGGAENVEWSVQLVGEIDDAIADIVKMDVVEGSGEAVVRNFGDYDLVWMVVSPLTKKEKAYNYEWTMDTFAADPIDPIDTGSGGSVDGEVGGCACDTAQPLRKAHWVALLLVGLLPLMRRQRGS